MYPMSLCVQQSSSGSASHSLQLYTPKANTIRTRSNGKTSRRMLTRSSIQSLVSGSWQPLAQYPN